ncbi:MAG: SpoIIE family protein phosphatase, partial [Rhodospirillales bacterium]|nr:SpoIIE family protein phosphatase [Rhodospirillales bacterium]
VTPSGAHPPDGEMLARLGGLVPFLRQLHTSHAGAVTWQRIALEGVRAVFPGHDEPRPPRADPLWAEAVREGDSIVWNAPVKDPATGLAVLTVSAPVHGSDGRIIGATALDVPVVRMLAIDLQPFKNAQALLVETARKPESGRGIRVIGGADMAWLEPAPGLDSVLAEMDEGKSNVRRLPFAGRDSLWAYGAVDGYGTTLLLVVPYGEVVAEANAAQREVLAQVRRQRVFLWASLAIFVPVVVTAALLGARAVTRPVERLAEAARRLTGGDFGARTDIRSGDELEMLGRLFNVMVPQLLERLHLRESLELAREVQQNLLPQASPDLPGFDVAGLALYCDQTGGDYYDFFDSAKLGPGRVAVAVGDVAGHGISAALLMTSARALLRSRTPMPGRLAESAGLVNRHIAEDAHGGRFMTLFLAVLDGPARRLHWVSAGHPPALLYDPVTDRFQELTSGDIPLGVDRGWQFEEHGSGGWVPGMVLLAFTDGIWETRDPSGTMFGLPALKDLLRAHAGESAAAIAGAVTEALSRYRGGHRLMDDVTLVVVKAVTIPDSGAALA